jgi:hypothetical protein
LSLTSGLYPYNIFQPVYGLSDETKIDTYQSPTSFVKHETGEKTKKKSNRLTKWMFPDHPNAGLHQTGDPVVYMNLKEVREALHIPKENPAFVESSDIQ